MKPVAPVTKLLIWALLAFVGRDGEWTGRRGGVGGDEAQLCGAQAAVDCNSRPAGATSVSVARVAAPFSVPTLRGWA
jgi:hypothetical protein